MICTEPSSKVKEKKVLPQLAGRHDMTAHCATQAKR